MQIKVCIGSACHVKGSYNVITTLQQLIEEDEHGTEIELKSVFCLGNCKNGVSIQIDEESTIYGVLPQDVTKFYNEIVIPKLV